MWLRFVFAADRLPMKRREDWEFSCAAFLFFVIVSAHNFFFLTKVLVKNPKIPSILL